MSKRTERPLPVESIASRFRSRRLSLDRITPTAWPTTLSACLFAAMAWGIGLAQFASGDNYYWTGTSAGGPTWNSITGGSNWSTNPNSAVDPGNVFPGVGTDVFFVFKPETNPITTLGQDFSIKGLSFTSAVTSPVTIGGANLLTIGTDGLTVNSSASDLISANVAIGGVETWANNSPSATTLTVSGQISGSAALTLAGTGSTTTPSGAFIFSGSDSYSGALTLLNANTSLTLSGNGSLASASSITLGGGSSLILDNGTTNIARLNGAMPVSSNGGTISLLGNSGSVTADGFGALNLNTGTTLINVTPNGATSATLTINKINRSIGSSVNFAPTSASAVVALTNSTLATNILGGWATMGDLTGAGSLDWATVSGSSVVAYSAYNTSTTLSTWAGTNVKASTALTVSTVAPNSLYLTGGAVLSGNGSANTITIGSGGVIANGGSGTFTFSGGVATTGVVDLGSSTIGNSSGSFLTVGAGTPELIFNVAGTYANPINPTAANKGVLEIAGVIKDGPNPSGTFAGTTTSGSNTVTLTSGTTAQLYPGVTVTGLTGLAGTQTVTSVIDSTHFTVGSNATTGGSGTPAFVSHTGITKNGGGFLDLSNFNSTTTAYTFTGPVTINGGVVVVKADTQLGAVPGSNTPSKVVLNGGDLRMVGTITIANARGMFLGPQGGQLSYTGGNTTHVSSFQMAGPGSIQFSDIPQWHTTNNNSAAMSLEYAAGAMTYTGATTLFTQAADSFAPSVGTVGAVIFFTNDNEIPALSPVTVTNVLSSSNLSGVVNMNGHSATWGSLAGNGDIVTDSTTLQTITVGGNNFSTTYSGNLGHSGLAWKVGGSLNSGDVSANGNTGGTSGTNIALVKNGTGVMTLSASSDYSGGTTINNGALRVTNTTGSATGTGAVTVTGTSATVAGALGGPGIITGPVTVGNFGQLVPTVSGTGATTLQLQGGLTLNSGSVLNFNLGAINSGTNPIASPTSDNVFVTGALAVGIGTDTINLAPVGSGIALGTYSLISASSVPASFAGTTFNVNGPLQFSYQVVDDTTNNSLELVVTTNPNKFFTWVGAPGNGTWDLNASNKPWTFTGSGGSFAYADGAFLTFDNTPGSSSAITVATNVAPGSMTFANNSLVNYTFSGPGQITGSIGITKSNTGSVTFNNTNAFTGLADIQNGSIVVGATGSLADLSFNVAAPASLSVAGSIPAAATLSNAGSVTFSNAAQTLASISGAGSLTLSGTALTIAGTSTYDGPIGGTGSLVTSGTGTLTLSNANSYGGGTNVGSGTTLVLTNTTGSGTGSGPVVVDGTLRGTGSAAGAITINSSGSFIPSSAATWGSSVTLNGSYTPGGAGAAATMSLGGTIINGGASLNYDLASPATSDTTNVPSFAASGSVALNVNGLAGFGEGTYTLFTSSGSFSDSATYTVAPGGSLSGYPVSDFSVTHDASHLLVTVTFPTNTWTGATNTTWDTSTINWSSGSGKFSSGDKAVFDDTNVSGNNAITIDAGGVNPSQVIFANSSQDYSINGPGVITGTATINKSGSGTATINTINTNVGATTITGGTLAIAGDGSLGTAPATTIANQLTINGGQLMILGTTALATTRGIQIGNAAGMIGANSTTGGTINVDAGVTTYNGVIANVSGQAGILNKTGSGELDLGGVNTFTGGLNINGGTLRMTNASAAGTGMITVNPAGTLALGAAPPLGGAAITLAGGIIGSSGAGQNLNNDVTAATGTTSIVDLFDPLNQANKFDLILGAGAGTTGTAALHGSGNIVLVSANGANTPESAAFRLRGPNSDFSGTITVGSVGKFEIQSTGQPGSPAGTGKIVMTGGSIDATNNGSFSLFNIRNISTTASVVYGNNVAVTGSGTIIFNQLGGAAGLTNTFGNLDVADGQFIATSATNGNAVQTMIFPSVTGEGGTATFQPGIPGNTNYVVADNFSLGPIGESGTSTGTTIGVNGLAAGVVTLTAANSYTGGTNVQGGTLRLGAAGALPSTTTLTVTGGTADLNNNGTSNSQSIVALAGTGGAVTNSDASNLRTLTLAPTGTTSYTGSIAGNLQLVINGAGAQALGGANTYTGGTNLIAGTLDINAGSALGTGNFTIGSGSTIGNTSGVPVDLVTNNPQTWSGSFTFGGTTDLNLGTGAVTLAASPTVFVNSNTLTVGGSIGDGGNALGVTKDGPGTLALAGANTFSGGMTVSAGTLLLSGTNSSAAATHVNAGTLAVTNASGSATGSGTVTVASGATLAGTGNIAGPVVFNNSGNLSPGIGAGGIGALHVGPTTLNTGAALDYDLAGLAAFDTTAVNGQLALGTSLTVNLNAESGFSLGTYNLVTSSGRTGTPSFTVNHSGDGDNPHFIYNVTTQGNNIVLIVDASAQKWTGAAGSGGTGNWDTTSVNWDPAVNGGLYQDNQHKQLFDDTGTNTNINVVSPVSPLAVLFANNTVPYTVTGQPITGSTAVVIQGPGTVTLSSPTDSGNTYTGGTTLLGGTLNIGNFNALGTGTLAIAGGSIDNMSGSTITLNNNELWSGSFTFLGSSDIFVNGLTVSLTTSPTVTVAAGTLTINATIDDAGAGYGFTKDGPGTMVLREGNTYSGTTNVVAGTLFVSSAGGTLGNGTAPVSISGGALDLGGTTQSVGAVNVTGGSLIDGTLTAASINVNIAADMTISANLDGAATLTKNGAATLTLSGLSSTYSGGTVINNGVVSIASDNITNGTNLGAIPAAAQPANITLNGGTLRVTAGTAENAGAGVMTLATTRGITLGPNGGTLNVDFVNTTQTKDTETALVYNGVITGPGGLTITGMAGIDQANQSIVGLSAPATYQGNTTISSAVAQVNAGNTGINNGAAVVNILPTTTTLNLINNGAWNLDSGSSNLTVAGVTGQGPMGDDATGRIGTTNQSTAVSLTLTGAGNYSFPGIIGAFTVAGKLGHDDRISVIMNGTGTQVLSGPNTYTGGTTVTSGTLTTTSAGLIGNGSLTVSAADGIQSVMNVGNNQPITSLSGTVAGSGSARVSVAAGVTLTDTQTTATTFAGTLALTAGATPHSGGTLRVAGGGTLEIQGAPALGNNSNINVATTSTLRFNVTSGAASVGTGVLATVSDSATLELAGSVPALDPAVPVKGRADVLNNSTASAGVHVTGTNQQVGYVDGTGTTQVETSSDLTANHIVQAALMIGGDSTHGSTVTIAASDTNGNSLGQAGGLATLSGSLAANTPLPTSSLIAGGSSLGSLNGSIPGGSNLGCLPGGGLSLGGGTAAVPEPSTIVMTLLGIAGVAGFARRRSR